MLKDEPHSQKSAEAAIGLRTDNGRPETIMLDTAMALDPTKPISDVAAETKEMNDDVEYDAFFSVY